MNAELAQRSLGVVAFSDDRLQSVVRQTADGDRFVPRTQDAKKHSGDGVGAADEI